MVPLPAAGTFPEPRFYKHKQNQQIQHHNPTTQHHPTPPNTTQQHNTHSMQDATLQKNNVLEEPKKFPVKSTSCWWSIAPAPAKTIRGPV